jgi:hypothetical protein
MDEEESLSGISPEVKGEIDLATRFLFVKVFIETTLISETEFKTMLGHGLGPWHTKLSHALTQSLKATTAHL